MVSRRLCQILPLLRPTLRTVPAQPQSAGHHQSGPRSGTRLPGAARGQCPLDYEMGKRTTCQWRLPTFQLQAFHSHTNFFLGRARQSQRRQVWGHRSWQALALTPRLTAQSSINASKTSRKKKEEKYEDHNKNLTPELPCLYSLYMLRSHQESNLSKLMISWPFKKMRWLPNYEKQTMQTDTAKFLKN